MNIIQITNEHKHDFISYCKKYRKIIDDSFLYDEDLAELELNFNNPTYIILNKDNNIKACASLMINDYYKKGKSARFRIFHSQANILENYEILLTNILNHTKVFEKVHSYLPLANKNLLKIMQSLSFEITRYIFVLIRDLIDIPNNALPDNYKIRPFKIGKDEDTWCEIRNISFANLKGSETSISPQYMTQITSGNDYIEGGMMILYHNEKAVGIIRGADDTFQDKPILSIGPIALLPEYQGIGLGKKLVRTMIEFAKKHSYDKTILCVNADNEKAKSLYINEGFYQVESAVCLELTL